MEGPLPHHFQHQQIHEQQLFPPPPQHHTLVSHLELDPSDPFQFNAQFDAPSPINPLHPRNVLDPQLQHEPRYPAIQHHLPQQPQHHPTRLSTKSAPTQGGQFGVLTPHLQVPTQPQLHHEAFGRLQNEMDMSPAVVSSNEKAGGHFSDLKMIPDPPDLDAWRERLFNVSDVIELTEDE